MVKREEEGKGEQIKYAGGVCVFLSLGEALSSSEQLRAAPSPHQPALVKLSIRQEVRRPESEQASLGTTKRRGAYHKRQKRHQIQSHSYQQQGTKSTQQCSKSLQQCSKSTSPSAIAFTKGAASAAV